jgi:hypothetical protein
VRVALHCPHESAGEDPAVRVLLELLGERQASDLARYRVRRLASGAQNVQHHREGKLQVRVPTIRLAVLCRGCPPGNERADRLRTNSFVRRGAGRVLQLG